MQRLVKPVLILAFLAAALMPSAVAAQPPGAVSSLIARDGEDVAFRWTAVAGSTWYYLWVNDATGLKYLKWYPDYELNCAPSQTTTCRIGVVIDAPTGNLTWWVQTWGPGGAGPWSGAQTFGPAPMFAVVTAAGVLSRGTATNVIRLALGTYEVAFARDITGCAFIGTTGGTGFESSFGTMSITKRAGNANGVFLETRDQAGAAVDRAFHLTIICR
jgi:hypothetical protein